jgi:hypothetical protein
VSRVAGWAGSQAGSLLASRGAELHCEGPAHHTTPHHTTPHHTTPHHTTPHASHTQTPRRARPLRR